MVQNCHAQWRAREVLGQEDQKAFFILSGIFLCLSSPSDFQMSVSVKKKKKQSIYVSRVSFCAATRAFDIVYLKLYSLKELSPCGSALNKDKRSIITPDAPRILIK